MLSLLLPCRNLFSPAAFPIMGRSWGHALAATSVSQPPCDRMRGGGGVCNTLQSAIFAPLALVGHSLFTATVGAILRYSTGGLSTHSRIILLLFLAPLFWSSLPATTVGRTCFDLRCSFSIWLSPTSASSVAFQHLSVLQTIQPQSL